MAARETINLDKHVDRWRWACPNGHRNWEPTNEHFWCQQCARAHDLDPVFHELHDTRSGETYERDELRLETCAGAYKDVYGEEGAP